MIVPTAVDWDGDGDMDLIIGQEDGRVAFVEHTGRMIDGAPLFSVPKFFRQEAAGVKFGALSTPVAVDWDGDGDEDIVSGNTAGYIGFFENVGGGAKPRWAAVRRLEADGEVIRIIAGDNGSIQGPCEAKCCGIATPAAARRRAWPLPVRWRSLGQARCQNQDGFGGIQGASNSSPSGARRQWRWTLLATD
jgi:hypothetical protein